MNDDHQASISPIETVIVPRARDLGEFEVRRALPAKERQMVGPFIFFDQMGPVEFLTQKGVSVRPHPHIGLGTITYLYEGVIHHRDSLGYSQDIRPGDVNWMIAGKGITHSERSPADDLMRPDPRPLFGIQTWLALPLAHEETDPSFHHHPKADLPMIEDKGISTRLIMGRGWGEKSPVSTLSDMFYADIRLEPGTSVPLPDDQEDRAIYVVEGEIEVAGDVFSPGKLVVFRPGDAITVTAGPLGAVFLALGGETMEGRRHIWWNFVASSKEKLEAAKEAWREANFESGRFRLPPDDNQEFIPLPT